MSEELLQYFRSCPPEILLSYRKKYLDGDTDLDTGDKIAAGMASIFSDRKQVRAILKKLNSAHHLALIALIQTGGVAGGTWLLQEMVLAHGKSEDTWADVLHDLGRRLLLFGNSHQAPPLFYIIPGPLLRTIAGHFTKRLRLPHAEDEGIRLSKDTNYNFPVGYSLTSLLTYLDQHRARVTQKDEIFKKNLEEALEFFSNLWGHTDTEKVMDWHLELLRMLGLTHNHDGHLVPHRDTVARWLEMGPEQRRNLFLECFHQREPLLPWLLQALESAPENVWVPVEPLNVMYRRRYMGSVFHKRFVRQSYYLPPSGFYNLNPPLEFVQIAGLVERGLGPDGAMLRLSRTGRDFLTGEPLGETSPGVNVKFLLQPSFEVLAPAGLPLSDLYRLGEMCQFVACDRMNRYLLTAETVLAAMDGGMRRSEVLKFLREGASHGMPQNVDSTVDEWIGNHGEVEFHDALMVTVQPDKEDELIESLKEAACTYRRMGPGVFAMGRESRVALVERLVENGLNPTAWVREYGRAGAGEDALDELLRDQAERTEEDASLESGPDEADFPARQLIVLQLPNADEVSADDSLEMFMAVNGDGHRIAGLGNDLGRKPGAAGSGDLLKLSPVKTLDLIRAAINRGHEIEILYRHTGESTGTSLTRVSPKQVHANGGVTSFDGFDHRREADCTYVVKRIQGIRLVR